MQEQGQCDAWEILLPHNSTATRAHPLASVCDGLGIGPKWPPWKLIPELPEIPQQRAGAMRHATTSVPPSASLALHKHDFWSPYI